MKETFTLEKHLVFLEVAEVHLVASGGQVHNEWRPFEWCRPKSTFNGVYFSYSCSAAFDILTQYSQRSCSF